jgi:hypothetical protein
MVSIRSKKCNHFNAIPFSIISSIYSFIGFKKKDVQNLRTVFGLSEKEIIDFRMEHMLYKKSDIRINRDLMKVSRIKRLVAGNLENVDKFINLKELYVVESKICINLDVLPQMPQTLEKLYFGNSYKLRYGFWFLDRNEIDVLPKRLNYLYVDCVGWSLSDNIFPDSLKSLTIRNLSEKLTKKKIPAHLKELNLINPRNALVNKVLDYNNLPRSLERINVSNPSHWQYDAYCQCDGFEEILKTHQNTRMTFVRPFDEDMVAKINHYIDGPQLN